SRFAGRVIGATNGPRDFRTRRGPLRGRRDRRAAWWGPDCAHRGQWLSNLNRRPPPSDGDSTVFLSWLRPRRKTHKRPASFRPTLESLDERIVPANPHVIFATSSVDGNGALVVNFKRRASAPTRTSTTR